MTPTSAEQANRKLLQPLLADPSRAAVLSDIDGTSSPVNEVVPPEQEDAVREAVHSCPEQAISIEE